MKGRYPRYVNCAFKKCPRHNSYIDLWHDDYVGHLGVILHLECWKLWQLSFKKEMRRIHSKGAKLVNFPKRKK